MGPGTARCRCSRTLLDVPQRVVAEILRSHVPWVGLVPRARGRTPGLDPLAAQFEALLAVYERVLGPEHPDTLTTRNNLAFWQGADP